VVKYTKKHVHKEKNMKSVYLYPGVPVILNNDERPGEFIICNAWEGPFIIPQGIFPDDSLKVHINIDQYGCPSITNMGNVVPIRVFSKVRSSDIVSGDVIKFPPMSILTIHFSGRYSSSVENRIFQIVLTPHDQNQVRLHLIP